MNMIDILKNIACNADQSNQDRLEAEAQLKMYGAHPLDNRNRDPLYYFIEESEQVYFQSRRLIHDTLIEMICDADEEALVRLLAEEKLVLYESHPWQEDISWAK
jgi:hypothetical protein